jgi:hypothetical protein
MTGTRGPVGLLCAVCLLALGRAGAAPSVSSVSGNTTHGDAGIVVADLRRSVAADLVARAGRSLDTLEALIDAETFFPYFDDYTFHGVFPGMTRQKWLSLIWQ